MPRKQVVTHLRHLLVHSGVLPQRDEIVAAMERWIDQSCQEAGAHRAVIQPYATWVVMRRARDRAQRRGLTRAGANYARSLVTTALSFLVWMDVERLNLASLQQADVDRWLAAGISTRYQVGDFLHWASRSHLCAEIKVPARISGDPAQFQDSDEQVELLVRCVDDMTLPLDVRAAGALVLLYGVPVSRIAQLTLQDIEEREDGTYIALGARPILMPPVVADLVAQQAAALPRSIAARTIDGTDWLFPGNLAGRPTTAMPLTRRLSTHGISVRPARNTAVLALAADLPATILSDVLGMHIVTAVDWVKYVKRDWTGYIEAKAADRHNQQEGM
ncbi:hypothetical protein [Streptomyces sp. KO7888]|uniref:hypothetical protein n=1 Tax=Streptomyces sp. KO7888 TaxID=2602737 RepID=UPI0013F67B0C|nr:hypothetical protein [Streptomyces sp. KO7888]